MHALEGGRCSALDRQTAADLDVARGVLAGRFAAPGEIADLVGYRQALDDYASAIGSLHESARRVAWFALAGDGSKRLSRGASMVFDDYDEAVACVVAPLSQHGRARVLAVANYWFRDRMYNLALEDGACIGHVHASRFAYQLLLKVREALQPELM